MEPRGIEPPHFGLQPNTLPTELQFHLQRRVRDSNPGKLLTSLVFKTSAFSRTLPTLQKNNTALPTVLFRVPTKMRLLPRAQLKPGQAAAQRHRPDSNWYDTGLQSAALPFRHDAKAPPYPEAKWRTNNSDSGITTHTLGNILV